MSLSFDVKTATVASGSNVSSLIALGNGKLQGIWAPVVDSGTVVKLKGSFDQTSANFVNLIDPDLDSGGTSFSTQWQWDTQGSEGVILSNPLSGFPYMKVETDLTQDDNRDFIFIIDFRP